MHLPPKQLVNHFDLCISGDVEIHPSAALASGVILQAASDCRIIIGADVCVGRGVIINAYNGFIELESGVVLGAEVLIIGSGKIGSNACIGSKTTIFQTSIAQAEVIPANSLIGDTSRQIEPTPEASSPSNPPPVEEVELWFDEIDVAPSPEQSSLEEKEEKEEKEENDSVAPSPLEEPKSPVIGQVYINQLLVTLFPHNQILKNSDLPKNEE